MASIPPDEATPPTSEEIRTRSPWRAAAILVGVLLLMGLTFPVPVVDWIDEHCSEGPVCGALVDAGWTVVDASEAIGLATRASAIREDVRQFLGIDAY